MKGEDTEPSGHSQDPAEERGNIFIFEARYGARPEENLAEFIRMARDDLTVFGADLDWNCWWWKGVGMFLRLGCPRKVKSPEGWHLDPAFTDFAKAYMRHQHVQNPTGKKPRMGALRAIEHVLRSESGGADPVGICLDTFDKAAQAAGEHFRTESAYGVGQHLAALARFVASRGLTHNDVGSWENFLPRPNHLHKKLGAEADAHRRAKLPDIEALNTIGSVFAAGFDLADNVAHPDVYATSIVAMLMGQPGRGGEIHELAVDLEIEQRDLEGDLQYGFRYRSYKAAEGTRIKWIPSVWAPFAREAVRRIREITEAPRAFARYVERQLEDQKKHPGAPIRFYRHPRCPNVADDEPLSAMQVALALGYTGDSNDGCRHFLSNRKITAAHGKNTLDSLWRLVLDRLPEGFPYVYGAKNKRLKYSEALFCMHSFQLKHGTRPNLVSLWVPSLDTLRSLLSSINVKGFFECNRRTGTDGAKLGMTSHQLRHLLNTLLHEGTGGTFVDNETINYWSGRDKAWQGVTYNHVPLEETARRAGEVLKNTGTGPGVIELRVQARDAAEPTGHWSLTHPVPKSCADPDMHHRSAVLMTLWGGCEHDWLLEPCPYHQDCINCKEHFCIKGFGSDNTELVERLRKLLSNVIHQQALAEASHEAGEFGAGSYYTYQTSYRERIEQLIALLESPDVPEGSKIKLAGATANTHLHRILREMALSKLIEMPEKKDVIEALVLAYKENRALPLDETECHKPGDNNA